MARICLPQVPLLGATTGVRGRGLVRHCGVLAHFRKAGGFADGLRLALGDLEPVVLRRIVTRRTHHAASAVQMVHGEVDEAGVHQPDIHDMAALIVDSLDQRLGERGRTLAHVAPDDDVVHHRAGVARVRGIGEEKLGDAEADLPSHLFVKRVRVGAANVVRLEDLSEHGWLRVQMGGDGRGFGGERVGRELASFTFVRYMSYTLLWVYSTVLGDYPSEMPVDWLLEEHDVAWAQ